MNENVQNKYFALFHFSCDRIYTFVHLCTTVTSMFVRHHHLIWEEYTSFLYTFSHLMTE